MRTEKREGCKTTKGKHQHLAWSPQLDPINIFSVNKHEHKWKRLWCGEIGF